MRLREPARPRPRPRATSPPTGPSSDEPIDARYRDREVLTNPPPSSGGILTAYCVGLLERSANPRPRDGWLRRWARPTRRAAPTSPRRSTEPRSSGACSNEPLSPASPPRPARLDDPPVRARPQWHRRQHHLLQRQPLRCPGAGHRRAPEQHARRGGPQPARLPRHRRPARRVTRMMAPTTCCATARSSSPSAAPAPTASARRSCR